MSKKIKILAPLALLISVAYLMLGIGAAPFLLFTPLGKNPGMALISFYGSVLAMIVGSGMIFRWPKTGASTLIVTSVLFGSYCVWDSMVNSGVPNCWPLVIFPGPLLVIASYALKVAITAPSQQDRKKEG